MGLIVGATFAIILGALAAAGLFMLRGGDRGRTRSGSMMRALAVRIGVSVLLFVCILAAWRFGWIHPTGIAFGK